jgi:uncharacterized protein (TIGR00369 family)
MKTADLHISPFQKFLGIELLHADTESVIIRLPEKPELHRGPEGGQYHGGVISSLIDIAGSYAVELAVGGDAPTVDLRIDYLRPASGALTATGRVIKRGRNLGVADVEVRDSDQRLVAVGRGSFLNTSGTSEKGNREL